MELTFLQKVDPQNLTIVVTDARGQKVPTEDPSATGKAGTLAFTEPAPSATPEPAASSPARTASTAPESRTVADAASSDGPGWWPLAAVVGIFVLLTGVIVGLHRAPDPLTGRNDIDL